jgi:hypothetical protein
MRLDQEGAYIVMLQDDLGQTMLKVVQGRLASIRPENEVLAVLIPGINRQDIGRVLTVAVVFVFADDYRASAFKCKLRII